MATFFGAARHRGVPAIGSPDGNRLDSAVTLLIAGMGGVVMLAVAPLVPHHAVMAVAGVLAIAVGAWAWFTPANAPVWMRQAYTAVSVPVSVAAGAAVEMDTELRFGPTVLLCPLVFVSYLRRARHAVPQLVWALAVYLAYLLMTQPPAAATVGFVGAGLIVTMVSLAVITLRSALDGVLGELREQVQRDPLTGLLNRLGLRMTLEDRPADGGAVVLIDLDHFKRVNDNHGHQEGDDTLIWFAELLTRMVRPGDCCARLGGEEFVAVVSAEGAERWAEDVRAAVAAGSRTRRAPITVSAGLAYGPLDDLPALLSRADTALYRAKANGRNRVEVEARRAGLSPEYAADLG